MFMKIKPRFAATAAFAALVSGQAAQASDVVYLGECSRAQTVKNQSTIDKLLVDARYEGMQRSYFGAESDLECDINELTFYSLQRRSSNAQEVLFDVVRHDVNYGMVENCVELERFSAVTGTVSFTTRLDTKGELCELYIWSDWKLSDPADPNWAGNFANRVTIVGESAFVVRQPRYGVGKYRTPLSFTGRQ